MPFIEQTDEHFKRLLAQARALKAASDKLAALDKRRGDNALAQANLIAERFAWRPLRAVAVIEEQTCSHCGHTTQMFRSWGIEYQRRSDDTRKIEHAEVLDEGLPLQAVRYILPTSTPACLECLPERNV